MLSEHITGEFNLIKRSGDFHKEATLSPESEWRTKGTQAGTRIKRVLGRTLSDREYTFWEDNEVGSSLAYLSN